MALPTANFIDNAMHILRGIGHHKDIYLPLLLLLLVLGVSTTFTSLSQLVYSQITLNLQSRLKTAIVRIHAKLDFKHIENDVIWELISRVSRVPVNSIMNCFNGFMTFIRVIFSVASFLFLIVTKVWWAAIIIVIFTTPLLWLSTWASKKNYHAGRDAEKFNRRAEYLGEILTGRDAVDERALFDYGDEINYCWQDQYNSGRILQLKVKARMLLITKGSSMTLTLIILLIAFTLISPVITGLVSAGSFMGIVGAVFGMMNVLGLQLSGSLESISKGSEYMKDLTAFITLSETEGAHDLPDENPPEFKLIEFKNVRFKYPSGDNYVLNELSFSLEEGKNYAFVGKNGAGKTTITKLLTGL